MQGKLFFNFMRVLLRYRGQLLTSLLSMSVGLTVFGFVLIYATHELSHNHSWPNANRIHRLLIEERGLPRTADNVSQAVDARKYSHVEDVKRFFPDQVEYSSRLIHWRTRPLEFPSTIMRRTVFVDPDFIDIFELEVVHGNLRQVLSSPGLIALEEQFALSLGEDGMPGANLTLRSEEGEQSYQVAAIYRLPNNLSRTFEFSQLVLLSEYSAPLLGVRSSEMPAQGDFELWVRLVPGVDTKSFNAMQAQFVNAGGQYLKDYFGQEVAAVDHVLFNWQPVTDIYLNPTSAEMRDSRIRVGNAPQLVMLSAIGILVLLVGCANCVSLSLASVLERRKVIGINKAAGATPADILALHLGESVLLALLALIPSAFLMEILMPLFRNLLPFAPNLTVEATEYLTMLLASVVVGLCTGIYPGLVLASTKPDAMLKPGGAGSEGSGERLKNMLVAAQYCCASILLIITAMLYVQLSVVRTQSLGFNPERLLTLVLQTAEEEYQNRNALLSELEKVPGISAIVPLGFPPAFASNQPVGAPRDLVREPGDSLEVASIMIPVDFSFFRTLEIPLLAGRFFNPDFDLKSSQATSREADAQVRSVLLNRTAARSLGFSSPQEVVGKTIYTRFNRSNSAEHIHSPRLVIGVVEDHSFGSMRLRPGPEMYETIPPGSPIIMLKYGNVPEDILLKDISSVWYSVNGTMLENFRFLDDTIASVFRQERNEGRLLLVCGVLSLLLAASGMYALASFMAERRRKEVGIRKVMGATVRQIIGSFVWRLSKQILVASLIAWPAALLLAQQWIERFPYALQQHWLILICFGVTLAVLLISLVTVVTITSKAASMKPVLSLRYE